ncbi:MAG: PTS sugar transporter subunit IIA [Kiritimatiellae bacterium]|nr:PTS sugar transporter subunit IIA [Kiritimatiellia bacterium]
MNVAQVARYLHMDPAQIARLVKQGEIPCEQAETHPLFARGEIDAWESQRILGMPERRLADYHRDTTAGTRQQGAAHVAVCGMLTVERTVCALQSRTKSAVLHDLTSIAECAGLLYDPKDLLHSLEEREALCSTGLVNGVAIVHPRHHDPFLASESFLVLARTAAPIPFGAPDGRPTDLFFLLVCQDDQRHLHSLARLCTLFVSTPLLEHLRAADSAAGMFDATVAAEAGVLKRLS